MKTSKTLIIATFIILFCLIGAASASDTNITDEIATTEVTDDIIEAPVTSDEVIELSDVDNEILLEDDEEDTREELQDSEIELTIPENMLAGDKYFINVKVPENASEAWIDVYLNNAEDYYTDTYLINGTGGFYFNPPSIGDHELKLHYYGNDLYKQKYFKIPVKITDYTLSLDRRYEVEGDLSETSIYTPSDFTGDIIVTINSKKVLVKKEEDDIDGTFYYIGLSDFKVGENTVNIYFEGDEKYHQLNKTFIVTGYLRTELEVNITLPDTFYALEENQIIIELPKDIEMPLYHIYHTYDYDEDIDLDVEEGIVIFNTYPHSLGKQSIDFRYPGDSKYKSKYFTVEFEVKNYTINLYDNDIEYSKNKEFYLNVPNEFTGDIIITFNGKKYTISEENYYEFIINNLKIGNNEVNIYYKGDETFHEVNKTVYVNVYSQINLYNDGEWNSSENKIYLNLPSDATGKLVVSTYKIINDEYIYTELYSSDANNGYAEINLSDLDVGSYDVYIEYINDDKYKIDGLYETINIGPKIKIPRLIINKGTIYFEANENENGILTVYINNDYYWEIDEYDSMIFNKLGSVELKNGKANFTLSNLNNYCHIKIEYITGNYTYISTYNYIQYSSLHTNIENNSEILPNEDGLFVHLSNDELYVKLTIMFDGEEIKTGTLNWEYYLSFENCDLTEGIHNITLICFNEEECLYNETYYINVTPIKIDIPKIIPKNEEYVDDNNKYATVYTPYDAKGNITCYVDGKEYEIINLNGRYHYEIYLNNLNLGSHDIEIVYSGDEKYKKISKAEKINVDYVVNLVTSTIAYREGDIKICLGNYTNAVIKIDDIEYNYTIDGYYATIDGRSLDIYSHELIIESDGKEILNEYVTVYCYIIHDYDKQEIRLNLPEDAEGSLKLEIDVIPGTGSLYNFKTEEIPLVNGKAIFNLNDLPVKYYYIKATYTGDDYYSNELYTYFGGVCRFNFNYTEIKTNESITVSANVTENYTGNFEVQIYKIGNMVYSNKTEFVNNYAEFEISNLEAGDYYINLFGYGVYNGEMRYPSQTYYFKVIPLNSNFNVEYCDINENEDALINISLTKNATGNVTVKVDGEEIKNLKANETLTVNITNLNVGAHAIEINYSGDRLYAPNSTIFAIIVKEVIPDPINPEININALDSIKLGDEKNTTIVLPADATGFIIVNIDGKEIINSEIISNITNISLANLTAGTHIIEVRYSGDEKYKSANEIKTVAVEKLDSEIKANAEEITEGESVTINIELNTKTNDVVLIKINDKQYYTVLNNGIGTIEIDNLKHGDYTATITYNGNNNYKNTTQNIDITVKAKPEKTNTTTKINIPENITTNQKTEIQITLPQNATGNITIAIDGKETVKTLNNGSTTINIENLEAGEHTIKVTYNGDENHTATSETKTITVEKLQSEIKAETEEITEGETLTINIKTNINSNDVVLIDINDKQYYTVINNGIATIKIDDLKSGNYTATITYNGNENYKNTTQNINITIKAKPEKTNTTTKINIPENITTNQKTEIQITLPQNATGNITASIDGKETTIPINNGTATISIENLEAGTHVVEIKYSGDENYSPVEKTSYISVEAPKVIVKKDAIITVDKTFERVATDYYSDGTENGTNGERGAKFYAFLTDIDGNPLVNKTVQIAVNGPIYNVTTDEKGRAGLDVNLAVANTYTYALSFKGDDEYNAAPLASSKLTVTKKSTSINAAAKTFKAKAKTKTISVTLNTIKNPFDGKVYLKAGKKLTLKINGKTYTAKTNSKGVAKFNIKLTKKGKYTTKISFAGDKTYSASAKSIKITIK